MHKVFKLRKKLYQHSTCKKLKFWNKWHEKKSMHMKYYEKWLNSYQIIPKISEYHTKHKLKVNILVRLHNKQWKT